MAPAVSKKWIRTLLIITIVVISGLVLMRSRSDGAEAGVADYEVPDFKKSRKGFDPSNSEYDPLDDIRASLLESPVVIFSKSYCPHSRFAKSLLSEKYDIKPAPLVRELDTDPHGHEIQDALLEISNRKTVPNVFVGGKSLGGGDEMRLLHTKGRLAQEFKKYGGRKLKISARDE